MDRVHTHTSCPSCGSSDARYIYEGGSSFCFSCRKPFRGSRPPPDVRIKEEEEAIVLPDDASFNYSNTCLEWVSKYGVTVEELIKHKVYWSTSRQQLIFTFYDDKQHLVLFQARNLGPPREGRKPLKYFTKGRPDSVLPSYGRLDAIQNLVLVEDCISAMRIARQCSAMPVLGSDLSLSKLKRIAGLLGPYMRVVVWLDGNMYPKAQRMARRLQMIGVDAMAVYTELDPKEYTDAEIKLQIA